MESILSSLETCNKTLNTFKIFKELGYDIDENTDIYNIPHGTWVNCFQLDESHNMQPSL
jgi:hypothetical protein